MSYEKSVKLWHVTYHKLYQLFKEDKVTFEQNAASKKEVRETDRLTTIFANLYLKYIEVVKNLGDIIDEIVQVQQRKYAQKIFDAANARLCELKESLCLVALSQFIYLDNHMIERRLIPYDIQFVTPAHLKKDIRDPEMQELFEKMMNGLPVYVRDPDEKFDDEQDDEDKQGDEIGNNGETEGSVTTAIAQAEPNEFLMYDEDEEVTSEESKHYLPFENPNLTPERAALLKKQWLFQEAVKLIQTCERVRQARILANSKAYIRKCRILGYRPKPLPPRDQLEQYVITIQRYWRGYYVRKVLAEEEIERKIKIGMLKSSWKSSELFDTIQVDKDSKVEKRKKRLKELEEFAEREETRVLVSREATMMEDISDEIIEWMTEWYKRTNWFDAFPNVAEGGTVLIVRGITKTVEEELEAQAEKRALEEKYALDPKLRTKDQQEAKRKRKEVARQAKEFRKKMRELERARKTDVFPLYNWEMTDGMKGIHEKIIEFDGIWGNIHFEENPWQNNYNQFVTEEKYANLNINLRKIIDEMMRIEYMLLIEAVNKDRINAFLKPLPVPKSKKGKKGGKGKKKSKTPTSVIWPPPESDQAEGERDDTSEKTIKKKRPLEDMFQELINNGIVYRYPKVSFDDIYSDWNYCASDRKQKFELPLPCLRDSIAAIKTSCVLPLGSREVYRQKGVMLIGPRKSGKKMIVHAICNETGAVLFDLTATNINQHYSGKKMKKLIRLVVKVSKAVQPTVFFFDGAEKPFYKSVPKEEKPNSPKAISKYLPQLQKVIGAKDLIMFISTSNKPWTAKLKKILKLYTKVILVPRLDYGSCLEFWKDTLLKVHGIPREFDFSSLAKRTRYFELPYLKQCIELLLTPTRLCELYFKPITPEDFFNKIISSSGERVSDAEFQQYIVFLQKTPYGQKDLKRQEVIQIELEQKRKAAAAAAKKAAMAAKVKRRQISVTTMSKLCNISSSVSLTPGLYGCMNDPENSNVKHQIQKFTWQNNHSMSVEVINYGATITKMLVPDKHNKLADIVQGFDSLAGYQHKDNPYHGATVGRVANRIKDGKFQIDGVTYNVSRNLGNNTLHGGFIGFNKVIWKTHVEGSRLIMTYLSKNGEEGFPGDLLVTVQMELLDNNEFIIDMSAVSTSPTPVNLTNHAYFNLAGHDQGPEEMKKHRISINSNHVTETDADSIPNGRIQDITNTPLDLQVPTAIGCAMQRLNDGFDHNYVIRGYDSNKCNESKKKYMATVCHPPSGRVLELYSDQPGVQFYTANGLQAPDENISDSDLLGKDRAIYVRHSSFCLEPQNFPNAMNIPHFPNSILYPGKVYRHCISFKFRIQE